MHASLRTLLGFAIVLLLPLAHAEGDWATADDIKRLQINLRLLDFPIRQGDVMKLIGVDRLGEGLGHCGPAGSWYDVPISAFGYNFSGYAFRMKYRNEDPQGKKPADLLIDRIDIVFRDGQGNIFLLLDDFPFDLTEIKKGLIERNESAKDYALKCYPKAQDPTR